MAETDKKKWDDRYSQDLGNLTPSSLLKKHIHQATVGRALDIACGNGKNSIFLAQQGFDMDAVDISSVAIENLREKAPEINAMCRDLDEFTIEEEHYNLILNANFLDRRLFPYIISGLQTGGLLIFESFTGAKTSKYCLGPNELLQAFSSLHIVYYAESDIPGSGKFEKSVALIAMKDA
ncbi:class I SAM-dependent methyltransferase [Desulforhopalus sp. 52FAK]